MRPWVSEYGASILKAPWGFLQDFGWQDSLAGVGLPVGRKAPEGSATLPAQGSVPMLARTLRNECAYWSWLFAGCLSVSQVLSLSLFARMHWDIDWNGNNPPGICFSRGRPSIGTEAIYVQYPSFKGSSPPLAVCHWVGSTRTLAGEAVSRLSLTSGQRQDSLPSRDLRVCPKTQPPAFCTLWPCQTLIAYKQTNKSFLAEPPTAP